MESEKRDGHNSLWNNIGKLAVLASKTADQEGKIWVMDSLEDYQINQRYMLSDLSKIYCNETGVMWASFPCWIQVQGPPALGEFFMY